jgi:hypothetical protein
LDIFLRGFSLSSCPQPSLKVLLLLNAMRLLKYVLNCEQKFSFLIYRWGLSVSRLTKVCCTSVEVKFLSLDINTTQTVWMGAITLMCVLRHWQKLPPAAILWWS